MMDSEMRKAGSVTFVGAEHAIVESQKAFKNYLEAECGRQVTNTMGGTIGADVEIGCNIKLINQRIALLK